VSRVLVRRALILGCVLVAVATAGVTAGAADAAGAGDTAAEVETGWTQADEPPSNATATRHENPDSVARSANASALERRLSGALTDRLSQSARNVEAGEYAAAQRLLADGYDERLTLYMEVYRTAVTADLERVERQESLLVETAALQSQYAETLSEYRQVAAEYERARLNENRDRAQRHARELTNLTRELRRIDRSLIPRYRAIDNSTSGSTATARSVVSATTAETAQLTAERVQATYTPTDVTAAATPRGSFADPVRLTGQLTAADGDPPTGTVSFRVNGRPVTTTVEPDGTFALPYRPVTATRGQTRLSVAYAPDDAALYLPSRTDVSTAITQSTPTVSIRNASERGRVGSSVTAAGRVAVDGVPVSNASVTLRVGERELAATRTDGDGTYRFDARLPANVSAGTRPLSVSTGATGTALAPASEETDLTVEETATRLTMSATRSEGVVAVSGRLVTDTETGVGGEDVVVSLNGEQRATVRTNPDGGYRASVELSNATNASTATAVQAAFDGSDTSLESATVGVGLAPPDEGVLPTGTPTLALVLAVGLVAVAAGGFGRYRYRREHESSTGSSVEAVQPAATDPAIVATPVPADANRPGTDGPDDPDADDSSRPTKSEDDQ